MITDLSKRWFRIPDSSRRQVKNTHPPERKLVIWAKCDANRIMARAHASDGTALTEPWCYHRYVGEAEALQALRRIVGHRVQAGSSYVVSMF